MTDTIYIRIKELRTAQGMTQQALAEYLGYKSRSSINKIEKGNVDIPRSKVEDFAAALRTTPAYLMGWNESETARLKEIENEILKTQRSIDRGENEEHINDMLLYIDILEEEAERLLEREPYTVGTLSINSPLRTAVRIPVFGVVPAGIPMEAIEDILDYEEIPREMTAGGREYFGLRVKGDSMEPEYRNGDTILIAKQNDCENGQIAVIYVNGFDATLKRVVKTEDSIILQPLNPAYDPMVYRLDDPENPITILGVVIEIRRKV